MTRLTNAIRDKIVKNATTKALTEQIVKLKQLRDDFTTCLLDFAVGDKLEELDNIQAQIKDLINKIPTEFRNYEDTTHINTDTTLYLNIGGVSINWYLDDYVVFPKNRNYDRFVIPHGHPLVKVWNEYEQFRLLMNAHSEKVNENVRAMVYSVSTVEKLVKMWPECTELLPQDIDKAIVNLPSVKVEELNALIGIPSEDK